MIELVKELILDAQHTSFFAGTPRRLKVYPVQKKATIIMGVRRCGKSTFLNQVAEHLVAEGISRENMLIINFFDDRLSPLKQEGLHKVTQAYFLLYPEKKTAEKVYCFFDEIQVVPGWEAFIDRILRTENCSVYISGSSAHMLSRDIATQMRGRALSWELFPFSFKEFTDHLNIKSDLPAPSRERLMVQKAFEEFYICGGFPEIFGAGKALRIKIHQEYFNSILFRDLIERYDISHPKALIDLARKLLENIASMYSLNSVTSFIRSLGHHVPKNSISDYLNWLEDAYFLFTVRMFDASYQRSNANPKKIYCVDHALVRSVTSGILINSGHILENIVFTALRRSYSEIFYYKTSGNKEIDFLVRNETGTILIYQVCESLKAPTTRQREIAGLQCAMTELGLLRGTIITREEESTVEVKTGIIEVKPIWRFLLEVAE